MIKTVKWPSRKAIQFDGEVNCYLGYGWKIVKLEITARSMTAVLTDGRDMYDEFADDGCWDDEDEKETEEV